MDPQSLEEGSIGNVSIHDLPGPEPGQELELLDSVHARYEGESVEGPNQQTPRTGQLTGQGLRIFSRPRMPGFCLNPDPSSWISARPGKGQGPRDFFPAPGPNPPYRSA